MSNDTQKTICLASTLPKEFIKSIDESQRPDIPEIRWTQKRNLFVNHHGFFQAKRGFDLQAFMESIQVNIYFNYFPIMLEPKGLVFSPSPSAPSVIEWDMKTLIIKDPARDIHETKVKLIDDMKECLKVAHSSYQSIEVKPRVIMGRVPKENRKSPDIKKAHDYELPKERFYIEDLIVVEISKDEFGVKYDYHRF